MTGFDMPEIDFANPMPSKALVFHEIPVAGRSGHDGFATLHDVTLDGPGGSPLIGAGRHPEIGDIKNLLEWIAGMRQAPTGFLPPHVLSISDRHLVWVMKGGQRAMWFNSGGKGFKLDVPWPALVVGVNDRKMSVAALAGSRRPTAQARLYHAPLMNVFVGGGVCTGNADLPESCGLDSIAAWEAVLTETAFSHVNYDATLKLPMEGGKGKKVENKDHIAFWRLLEKRKAAAFPKENLAPMGLALAGFIGRVAKGA